MRVTTWERAAINKFEAAASKAVWILTGGFVKSKVLKLVISPIE